MMQQNQLQVLPSPARLGLSNPHSPSPPNPQNPPPKQIYQRTSTLLSLLPPHSRAQSILHHMAALTTKLFEVSGNKAYWLTAFRGSLPTFLPSQTLPPEGTTASTTKEVLALLLSLQTQLFEAVAELQEVIDIEELKQKTAHEIQSKDSSILSFAKKVKEAEKVLELIVEDYEDYRKPKRFKSLEAEEEDEGGAVSVGKNSHLKLSDILSYAHRISYTTFAPPEFGAGLAPLRGALPPAPQEEQMRASQLYHFADLDVGLPKVESKERIAEPLFETVQPAEPTVDLKAIQNMLIPPPIPSGWRPGMPIELPGDIPLVPPGWKPGDPVPLPPMVEVPAGWKPGDAIVLPKPDEPLQLPPKPMGAVGVQPEPIQVPFVQLDINPDQDEYSSDYSSDEGSSEADDEE